MTGPNLEPGRKALELLMDDTCTITRDPSGTGDDGFDQATGTYTPPPSDVSTVYSGKCMLSVQGNVGREGSSGGGSFQIVGYKLQIPISGPELHVGDWVELTSSRRDPAQVGKRFQVTRPQYATMAMTRAASLTGEETVGVEP